VLTDEELDGEHRGDEEVLSLELELLFRVLRVSKGLRGGCRHPLALSTIGHGTKDEWVF
jgi:hypothetical protein